MRCPNGSRPKRRSGAGPILASSSASSSSCSTTSILNVALPSIVREFDATNTQLRMVDAYTVVFAGLPAHVRQPR